MKSKTSVVYNRDKVFKKQSIKSRKGGSANVSRAKEEEHRRNLLQVYIAILNAVEKCGKVGYLAPIQ